jgi:hypothetical protein
LEKSFKYQTGHLDPLCRSAASPKKHHGNLAGNSAEAPWHRNSMEELPKPDWKLKTLVFSMAISGTD